MIVGFAGKKGSGKDTAAQALSSCAIVKFADPLKEMTRALFRSIGVTEDTIARYVDGDMKETPLACLGGRTTRQFMQWLGTEFGRVLVWDGLWVNAFGMRAAAHVAAGHDVACTDVRFPNEVAAIKREGGVVLMIERPGLTAIDGHASEDTSALYFDAVIVNDGTVEDLHRKVRGYLSTCT